MKHDALTLLRLQCEIMFLMISKLIIRMQIPNRTMLDFGITFFTNILIIAINCYMILQPSVATSYHHLIHYRVSSINSIHSPMENVIQSAQKLDYRSMIVIYLVLIKFAYHIYCKSYEEHFRALYQCVEKFENIITFARQGLLPMMIMGDAAIESFSS